MKQAYENLKRLCRVNDITLGKLEKELNLGTGSLKEWSQAKRGPSVIAFKKVADYFGLTMDELMNDGTGNSSPNL